MRAGMADPSFPTQYNGRPPPAADGRRSRVLPTLAVILVTPLFIGLGLWQLDRARQKRELITAFEQGGGAAVSLEEALAGGLDAALYRHVRLEGRYLPDRQFLLDGQIISEGEIGYDVLTPLVLPGDRGIVLVDRGFIRQDASRNPVTDVAVADTDRAVQGRIGRLPRALRLGPASESASQDWPRVMLYPERAELEAALGRPLLEPIVLLDADEPDGYVRKWRVTEMSPERHVAYALQWFAFAATLVVIYVSLMLRSRSARH
jgi:surfeit locus 1 family protein